MSIDGAGFEAIAEGYYLEGLLVDGDDVWYTDVTVGGVRRVDSDEVLLDDRTLIGGLFLNRDGSLLVGGQADIAWVNPKTGASGLLVAGFQGTNEMCPDGSGGLIFGETDLPSIKAGRKPGPSAIHHIAADRSVTRLWEGLTFANGLGIAADGGSLFFNESFSAARVFPIREDGGLSAPRTLVDKQDCDGMALDAEGNIWITGFASDHLLCVRPDGDVVRRVPLPGKAASSVRFGGADMRDLYVTVVDTEAAQYLADGVPIPRMMSTLYRGRSPVAGAPVTPTAFRLT